MRPGATLLMSINHLTSQHSDSGHSLSSLLFHATACPQPLSRLIFTNHFIGSAFEIQEEIGVAPLCSIHFGSVEWAIYLNSSLFPTQRTFQWRNAIVGRTVSQKSENNQN